MTASADLRKKYPVPDGYSWNHERDVFVNAIGYTWNPVTNEIMNDNGLVISAPTPDESETVSAVATKDAAQSTLVLQPALEEKFREIAREVFEKLYAAQPPTT